MVQPQGYTAALREAAKLLVAADHPVIVADRAVRSARGLKLMVELAEALTARLWALASNRAPEEAEARAMLGEARAR